MVKFGRALSEFLPDHRKNIDNISVEVLGQKYVGETYDFSKSSWTSVAQLRKQSISFHLDPLRDPFYIADT